MKTQENLYVEYVEIENVQPYENNARHHEETDLEGIKQSIEQFGMNDPIGVWSEKNIIVEGHGRYMVLKELGWNKIPIIHLDHMSDEERRAYALAHNKTAELSKWDDELLNKELSDIFNIDMAVFGFEISGSEFADEIQNNMYTTASNIPQYEITGECPAICDLINKEKTDDLIGEILNAEGITKDEKEFLVQAANRHTVFNYRNIAEYYAHATAEMQRLMEKSALVIIDIDNAIANGYATLLSDVVDAMEDKENAE